MSDTMTTTYELTRAIAVALLGGAVLTGDTSDGAVTVGGGKIVDWRHVRSGEELALEQDSAADLAILFVALVGEAAARRAHGAEPLATQIHEYPLREGDRYRSFKVAGYEVRVSHDWGSSTDFDDDDARDFTRRLAAAAER